MQNSIVTWAEPVDFLVLPASLSESDESSLLDFAAAGFFWTAAGEGFGAWIINMGVEI